MPTGIYDHSNQRKIHSSEPVKYGRDIGKKPKGGAFRLLACPECGKTRWVILSGFPKRCKDCALKSVGSDTHNWKGGRIQRRSGYIDIRIYPDDFFYSMAQGNGYVLEHRLVVAKILGRSLHTWEIVHHKGTKYPKGSKENRGDNRIENLQLVSDDRHKQITLLESKILYQQSIIQSLINEIASLKGRL